MGGIKNINKNKISEAMVKPSLKYTMSFFGVKTLSFLRVHGVKKINLERKKNFFSNIPNEFLYYKSYKIRLYKNTKPQTNLNYF